MIVPIVTPKIDFKGLLASTKSVLHRNLNNSIDPINTIDTHSPLAYLCELLELEEIDANIDLVAEYNLLQSLSYSFLTGLEDEDILLLHCYTSLSVVCSQEEVQRKRIIIITGSLKAWKDALIYFATQSSSTNLKVLSKHLYLYFDSIKLASTLWKKYNPVFCSAGELLLELK